MASAGTVVITMDADVAKVVEGIKKTNKQLSQFQRSANKATKTLSNIAKTVAGIYLVEKAFDGVKTSIEGVLDTSSQFENYTNRMTAFTQVQAQANAEVDRGVAFALKYKTSINDTMDALLLMKNYGLDDSNESLKIFTNTAIGSGKSLSQYAEAVADALTGENERLKEFGLKASKIGEQIGYVWTDSAGKTRNVIIENNKEIINSTLNAIMNEKYVGQLEKRASSWAGLMQNMSNNFTVFQKNIGDAGLFDYFKQLGDGISKVFADSFNSGSISAKQFSDDTISFMNSIIKAVGFVAKALAGVANLARTVYGGIQKLAGTFVGGAADERLKNKRADLAEAQRVLSTKDYGLFSNQNYGVTTRKIRELKKEIASTVATQTWAKDVRASGDATVEAAAKSQANINALVDKVTALGNVNRATIKATTTDIDKQKEAATKALNSLDAGYGQLNTNITKLTKNAKASGKAQTQAIKDAQKESKKLQDQLDATARSFADIFNQGFESILKGDFAGGLADIFGNAMQKATSNLSSAFSGGLSNLFSGSGSFLDAFKNIGSLDIVGSAVSLLGGLLSTTLSEAEIAAARGRSGEDIDSKGTAQIVDTLEKYGRADKTVSKSMLDHLESMDKNLLSALGGIGAPSLNLNGSGYTPETSSIAGGVIFASTEEWVGGGIKFQEQAVSSFIEGVDAVGYEAIKETSTYLGLFTSESIREETKDLGSKITRELGEAFNDGLQSSLDGLEILGFNVDAINAEIQNYVLDIGKIDFTDLDPTEQAEALNRAFTEQMSNALTSSMDNIADPDKWGALKSMSMAGEEITMTVARVATGLEQVNADLAGFGNALVTFTQSQALIDATGSLENYTSQMNTYLNEFYTDEERSQFYQQQIANALAVYDVSLPASKEQYRALIEETKAKIFSIQASIDARKSEISAQIAAGTYQKSYTENYIKLQEALGDTLNNSGKQVVAFGNSVNSAIVDGITKGKAEAESAYTSASSLSDIDFESLGDPTLISLESELASLQGLYGTLMENAGAYSSAMGTVSSATGSAATAISEAVANINRELDILSAKKEFGMNSIAYAEEVLRLTTEKTGLGHITESNILAEYTSDAEKERTEAFREQYAAILALKNAQREYEQGIYSVTNAWNDTSSLEVAAQNLELIQKYNNLGTQTYETFFDNFNEAMNNGFDDSSLEEWQQLSEAILSFHDLELQASKDAAQAIYDLQVSSTEKLLEFGRNTLVNSFSDLESAVNNADYSGASSAYDSIISQTKEDGSLTYRDKALEISRANQYIQTIDKRSANQDIVDGIEALRKENEELRKELALTNETLETIERNTYATKQNTDDEYTKVVNG